MKKIQGTLSDFARFKEDGGRFVIGYGLTQLTDTLYEWFEITIYKRQQPIVTLADVKNAIIDGIDAQTDERILSGFAWNDKPVWLSSENQFNFKAAYDVAVQSEGASLPVKFKLGEDADGHPVYHTFTALSAFTDFYTRAIAYINQCLNEGWAEKDGIDWAPYEALFPAAASEAIATAE